MGWHRGALPAPWRQALPPLQLPLHMAAAAALVACQPAPSGPCHSCCRRHNVDGYHAHFLRSLWRWRPGPAVSAAPWLLGRDGQGHVPAARYLPTCCCAHAAPCLCVLTLLDCRTHLAAGAPACCRYAVGMLGWVAGPLLLTVFFLVVSSVAVWFTDEAESVLRVAIASA